MGFPVSVVGFLLHPAFTRESIRLPIVTLAEGRLAVMSFYFHHCSISHCCSVQLWNECAVHTDELSDPLYELVLTLLCDIFLILFWVLFWFASLRCLSKRSTENLTALILSLVIADINYCYYLFLLFDFIFIVEYFSKTDKNRLVQLCTLKTITAVVWFLLTLFAHYAYTGLLSLKHSGSEVKQPAFTSKKKKGELSSCLHFFQYLFPGSSSQI